MSFPGAPAALRGFRLQHLYTLHRLLTDPAVAGLDVQLEGSTHLAIFDATGRILETVQVQSDDALDAAFFERARRRLRESPEMVQRIAIFGPAGRMLLAMSAARGASLDGETRASLERHGFSRKQIDAFRAIFLVDAALDEAAMQEEVHAWLRENGLDPELAFLHLSAWMHERRRIHVRELRETLAAIARYADDSAAHADVAIHDATYDDATYDDDTPLDSIDAAFARMQVVVVHGANKSALAARYLRERMPSAWRFPARDLRQVTQTMRAATRLATHARAVGVPLLISLDVAPRDLAWTALVEELRVIRGVRILVTIGEQQWTRARNSGAMLMAADVPLASGSEDALLERPSAEQDLEAWLLHQFTAGNEPDITSLQPQTIDGAAGVLRALLWQCVQRYTIEQAKLIDEVQERVPGAEMVWAILDPAGLARYAPSLVSFEDALKLLPEMHAWYLGVKERRPSPEQVFAPARQWLAAQSRQWQTPQSETDWQAAAELLFWSAAWDLPIDREPLASALLDADVPTAILADVLFAASFASDDSFERARLAGIARFQRETTTITIDSGEEGVMAHWVLPFEADLDVERETARRLDLLRRLYPREQAFGGHVYGSVSGEVKRAIPADQFPVPWLLRVHLLFARLVLLDRRGETWAGYVASVVAMRERIVHLAAKVTQALTLYFRRDKAENIFEAGVDAEEWDALIALLGALPKLPRSAVDEWGFETEGPSRAWSAMTPNAHAPYVSALSSFASAMREFLLTSWRVFIAHPHIGRGSEAGREKVAAWSEAEQIDPVAATRHLAEAVKRLGRLQSEFRARFALHAPNLAALERREAETLRTFWAVWYDFAFHPRRRIGNATRDSVAAIESRLDERRRALRRRLRSVTTSKTDVLTARERGEAGGGLWITVDVPRVQETVNGFAEALVHVIDVLRPPADFNAFDRYALDLVWEEVHLVPLVRGKSVEQKAWTLSIVDLPRPDEDLSQHSWKFVPRRIDDTVWPLLELQTWPASAGSPARRLASSAAGWRDAMRHVVNLRELPLHDDTANELLAMHWREAIAIAERSANGVAAGLAALPTDFPSVQPELLETLQILTASLRDTIAATDVANFAAIEEATATIADTIVPTSTALADLWLDRELS